MTRARIHSLLVSFFSSTRTREFSVSAVSALSCLVKSYESDEGAPRRADVGEAKRNEANRSGRSALWESCTIDGLIVREVEAYSSASFVFFIALRRASLLFVVIRPLRSFSSSLFTVLRSSSSVFTVLRGCSSTSRAGLYHHAGKSVSA